MIFFEWLNGNSGAVTAISTVIIASFTIVAAFITAAMARINRDLLEENRLLRKAGTEPEVAVYLKADSKVRQVRNLVLANVGQRAAKNIVFTILADEGDFIAHDVSLRLSVNSKIKGASLLPQGESIESYFGSSPMLMAKPSLPALKPFEVEVTYENTRGVSMSAKYELDVDESKWIAWTENPLVS